MFVPTTKSSRSSVSGASASTELKTILLAPESRVSDAGLRAAYPDGRVESDAERVAQLRTTQRGRAVRAARFLPHSARCGLGSLGRLRLRRGLRCDQRPAVISICTCFPLTAGGQSNLDRLLEWPDRIRAIDPGKRIVMSELWLYKAGAGERSTPSRSRPCPRATCSASGHRSTRSSCASSVSPRARKASSWWRRSGRDYFFAYLDYNDPLTFNLRPTALLNLASQRAYAAILNGQHTDTGLAFRGM